MKRAFVYLLAALMLLACAGCGGKASSGVTSGSEPSGSEKTEAEHTLTGTLDEVKDFMFVVTDDQGESYALTFEGKSPEGLEDRAVGDRVTVTYTGELSVVDPFTGTVLSVKEAE